jgi:uncharacterized protein DUF3891
MLIRPGEDGALAIGQLSHAWLAGQLARAWGNERFGAVDPREGVALGAEQHDVGWALFDLEPRWNPDTGLPHSFLELTVEDHLAIWTDAPDHLLTTSLHAAMVVSMHGSSLSELRQRLAPDQAAAVQEHIDTEHARQAELRERLGVSEAQAERTRRQMWTWDGLSLALCHGWQPFVARDVPTATDGELVDVALDVQAGTVDPWPFATDTVEVGCEARRLAPRYEDEAAMHAGYRAAPAEPLRFALRKATAPASASR